MVNYRDYHSNTQGNGWRMTIVPNDKGVHVSAFPEAVQLQLFSDRAEATPSHDWYYNYELIEERNRGLNDRDDNLHAATFQVTLQPGESVTLVGSTEQKPDLDGEAALKIRRSYEQKLLGLWKSNRPVDAKDIPLFANRLVLAADQFIVNRSTPEEPHGKTIIAGYHWFGDWGRDTMISLPGLTLATGRPEVARSILRTFARYVDQGMLPNRFPDEGEKPEYNTVDATLWYFEAVRAYYGVTEDDDLVQELFPVLADIIRWHCKGTRYNIHLDPADGLLYAGEPGCSLPGWMPKWETGWSLRALANL